VFTTDPFTGLGFARDRRDDGYVVHDPSSDGNKWARHLKRNASIALTALTEHLVPLNDTDSIDAARAEYDSWLARARVEKAHRDAEQAREEAEGNRRRVEDAERVEREAASRAQFVELLADFEVVGWDGKPLLPLLPILLRLNAGENLIDDDYAWLQEQRGGLSRLAALGHHAHYRRIGDLWHLIRACSAYRDAGMPEQGLTITDDADINACPANVAAALLTTRGGAYRDVGNLEEALASGEASLRLSPSPHAHALLGGVYFDRGDPENAEKHFEHAGDASDRTRKRALLSTPVEQRSIAAAFLLRKDPVRYAWATTYILAV
jgi:tetratricopeptide (TPR) repeat protein